jgi:hypothetical protein
LALASLEYVALSFDVHYALPFILYGHFPTTDVHALSYMTLAKAIHLQTRRYLRSVNSQTLRFVLVFVESVGESSMTMTRLRGAAIVWAWYIVMVSAACDVTAADSSSASTASRIIDAETCDAQENSRAVKGLRDHVNVPL